MKKIFLCGHTGSVNRGCEAIISSTVDILKMAGAEDVTLMSFNKQDDINCGLDKKVKIMSYPRRSFVNKIDTYFKRKMLKKEAQTHEYLYKNIFKQIKVNDSILFNVGGDTYCYGIPYVSIALNNMAERKNVPTVFWGCSVEKSVLETKILTDDINKYSAVVVREKLSQDIFMKGLKDQNKIYKTCDPAFHLEIKETGLPCGFVEKNTLGLNVSALVFADYNDQNDIMYQNIYSLIDYILEETNLNVCLIPHVYNIEQNLGDIVILRRLYEKYAGSQRVSLVDKELSCSELKYIISKCRFFIGARTHSTIAAYSTAVPCIALSYSIKSRGIATDLFETEEGYALPYKNIKEADEIKNAFVSVLYNNEQEILKRYSEILPNYKQSIVDATKIILEKL